MGKRFFKYSCLLLVFVSLFAKPALAQTEINDSTFTSYSRYSETVDFLLPRTPRFIRKLEYKTEKSSPGTFSRIFLFSAEIIASGMLYKGDDTKYKNRRTMDLPVMRNNFEDFLQYAPGAAMIGLKLAGVEGRSSWTRMLVTDALGVGLTVGSVKLIKDGVDRPRPDGSDHRSFPSGHSAMAFLGATLLHREYGLTRSPWYSIGGYSTALVTSVARELHNKHWLSDVMVGAGIGILAGEIAYQITDLLFKKKGALRRDLAFGSYDYESPHSSVGLEIAGNYFLNEVSLSDGAKLKVRSSFATGFFGEWGLTPHWSLVWRYHFTNALLYYNEEALESRSVLENPSWYKSSNMRMHDLDVGLKYSQQLSLRWNIYGKATLGCTYYNKIENEYSLRLGERAGANFGGGLGLGYLILHNLWFNTFLDYRYEPPLEHKSSSGLHNLLLGYSASVLF